MNKHSHKTEVSGFVATLASFSHLGLIYDPHIHLKKNPGISSNDHKGPGEYNYTLQRSTGRCFTASTLH